MYYRFKSYFAFVTKEKFHFSLTCSFYYCLVKEGWALKVAWQLVIQGLFAYKGAYIKYVGGGAGGFYKFFKKNFEAQVTIDLKYFLAQ